MSGSERRDAARFPQEVVVLAKVLGSDGAEELDGRIYTCNSADVSAGGLRLRSTVALSPGTRVDLRLRSGEQVFVMTGIVRWGASRPQGFEAGLAFAVSVGDDSARWQAWVESF